jgi:N-formylglutamate deformylase
MASNASLLVGIKATHLPGRIMAGFSDSTADTSGADTSDPPYRLLRPARQRVPFLFSSPHSGRRYPPSLLAQSRLDALSLRRSEDAYVDQLFAGVVEMGAPLLAAEFPRAYLDANRGIGELDQTMFEAPLDVVVDRPGPRVMAGLGVIPRIVRDGAEIYRRKLPVSEAHDRLARLYKPYHQALHALMEETHARFGVAVLIDCHSMPSTLAVPDVVLGDRYGSSAGADLTERTERALVRAGFSVGRNQPYAGGHTAARYGQISRGRHVLQIEINRALYLDEDHIVRKPGFQMLCGRLERVMAEVMAPPLSGFGAAMPEAAE